MKTVSGEFWCWDRWIQKWVRVKTWHFGIQWYKSKGIPICVTKDFAEKNH